MGRLAALTKTRLSRLLAGCLLASAANFAGAVGLGVLEVESPPGEPLHARIPLIDLGAVRPTELGIAIASVADYAQANASRHELLSDIRLHVETGAGGAWVVLTTERPIPASSSMVILDTTWPGGRILSQHLLRIGAAAAQFIPAAGAASADGESAGAGGWMMRTVSGDSLWRIAERLTAENPADFDRTMLALHRSNPAAFINGDMDRLRADVELRIPDWTGFGAANRVSARNQTVPRPATGDIQPEPLAASAPRPAAQDDQPDGQLSLLVAEGGDDGQGGDGDDALDARIAELENQLALSLEEADRVRVEREELRARLDDLDAQIAMAREIIQLRERELAQLRASLAAQAEEEALREAEQAAARAAAEAEARAAAEAPRNLLENPLYLVIGAAILVLALVLLLMRRGEREAPEEAFVAVGGAEAAAGEQGADEPHAVPDAVAAVDVEADPVRGGTAAAEAADDGNGRDRGADPQQAGEEEIAEQLNLAYSLHKMGDTAKARELLENVIRRGDEDQIGEARQLLAVLDDSS